MVQRLGYQTMMAADGEEAVTLFHSQGATIDCVLLDLTMPRLDGLATFKVLKRIRPEVPIILCSGYSQSTAEQAFAGLDVGGWLEKPFDLKILRAELGRVLGDRTHGAPLRDDTLPRSPGAGAIAEDVLGPAGDIRG
jgi:CheY-like chemotaxis protein